jgi:hypothetical protein
MAKGRGRARQDQTEHVIHKQDGTIGERNSYGHDPASRSRASGSRSVQSAWREGRNLVFTPEPLTLG